MADEFPSEMMFTHQIPRHLLTVAVRGADVGVGGGHPLIWKKASRFQYSQRWAIDIERTPIARSKVDESSEVLEGDIIGTPLESKGARVYVSHRPLPHEYFLERLKPVNILVPSL
eukprot:451042_1